MARTLIFFLTCLICLPHAHAQHQLLRKIYDTKTNTWAQVTCLLGKLPPYGYAPIRIEINNGTDLPRNFTLDFTSRDNTAYNLDSGSRINSSFSCSAEAGTTEIYDFLVPVVTILQTGGYGNGSELIVQLSSPSLPSSNASMTTETHEKWPSALLSNELYIPNASSLNSHISAAYSKGGNLEFAGEFNPQSMPTDWRAYIGQDVIIMTSNNWSKLDPGARTAILEWNRLGGHIIIYTANNSEDLATLRIDKNMTGKRNTVRSLGLITLTNLPKSNKLNPNIAKKLVTSSIPGATPKHKSRHTSHASLLYDYSAKWPLHTTLGTKNFNTAFFIIILLIFAILVGPINLFVFAKAGKRHKLFITTPIISLAASALLIIIIMFQDGFGGHGHRSILMEIQPNENKAYIIQEQAARTGVLLGSSFETTEPTLITPVALSPSRWARVVTNGNTPSSYLANHSTNGMKLNGDWFQSRSVHGHLLKTVRPTRGKITLTPRDGTPVITSSFDFDLGTLFYHSKDNAWWKTQTIKKGQSVTLTPSSPAEFKRWLRTQSKLFSHHNATHLNNLATNPNRFFTTTENAPGITTSDSINWLTTTTVITGNVKL